MNHFEEHFKNKNKTFSTLHLKGSMDVQGSTGRTERILYIYIYIYIYIYNSRMKRLSCFHNDGNRKIKPC